MLPKNFRLRKNADFRKIYSSKSKSIADPYLVLYIRKNHSQNNPRIGFSISKKLGKAHERNHLKRQLREIARKNLKSIKPGYDLIFIARQKISGKGYRDIEKSMEFLLKKGRIINE
ncbi:MAG: ribonuclease P protein component [Peptococcales bacterium]